MKRILVIVLCLISMTTVIIANEMEDSINLYTEQVIKDYQSGDYDGFLNNVKNVTRIYKVLFGDVSHDMGYSRLVSAYSDLCYEIGYSQDAILLETEANRIKKNVLGETHSDFAISLSKLAEYYSDLGFYSKALELGTRASEILKKNTLGKDDIEYALSLDKLASYHYQLDNCIKAVEISTQALDILRKTLGQDDPEYALSLNSLALYYSKLGNYLKAIEISTQAMEILKAKVGENHPYYCAPLSILATCYGHLGNYTKAIKLSTQAMEIVKEEYGETNPNYALSLGNVASYYRVIGNFPKAIELTTLAKDILQKTIGVHNHSYAMTLNSLALAYSYLTFYSRSIEYGTQAAEILKSIQGEDRDYATVITNLANYYAGTEDYTKAIELDTKALEIFQNTIGKQHPYYAISLRNLIDDNFYNGSYNVIAPLINEYMSIVRNNIFSTFIGLTSSERHMYWDTFTDNLTWIQKILVDSYPPNAAEMLYDNIALFSKGLLLSTELEITKLIQESGDLKAQQLYSELRQNRQILNVMYSKPIMDRYINCDSIEHVSFDLERQLMSRVKEFGDYTRNLSISWQDVQSKLGENDIAIEFLSYPENYDTTTYVALTLCNDDTIPVLTPLFDEQQLFNASGENESYQTTKADEMIWSPLSSRLEGKTHVYFSASGILHNIGIEYLPSMDGKECYRLSSTRELAIKRSETPSDGAVVYGGIQYATDVSQMGTPRGDGSFLAHRGFNPDSVTQRGSWDYLPGSLDEANEVDSILAKSDVDVKKVTGLEATETTFKDLSSQRKRILHIATHGFYYNDSTAHHYNERERLGFLQMDNDHPRYVEDKAMTRTGLLFTGAQNTFDGVKIPDGVDDGVLTAQEVSQLDLRGLDLLVLSACQTGLGEVTSDGVFGLQRGFKKAGAQSILMSLWKVDDEAAHMLMTEFYRGWTTGLTKYAALRHAQSVVKEKYPDPRHWAAFILMDALD